MLLKILKRRWRKVTSEVFLVSSGLSQTHTLYKTHFDRRDRSEATRSSWHRNHRHSGPPCWTSPPNTSQEHPLAKGSRYCVAEFSFRHGGLAKVSSEVETRLPTSDECLVEPRASRTQDELVNLPHLVSVNNLCICEVSRVEEPVACLCVSRWTMYKECRTVNYLRQILLSLLLRVVLGRLLGRHDVLLSRCNGPE